MSTAQHPDLADRAAHTAETLLDEVWREDLFPVDPYKIAAFQGTNVYLGQIPGDVSCILLKEAGSPADITVDEDDAETERRFAVAHALGHMIVHGQHNDDEYTHIESRGSLAALTDPDEQFADAFAASLLMPETTVRMLQPVPGVTTYWLARYFVVPRIAMLHRIKSLGLTPM